jgi:hypothetical protein
VGREQLPVVVVAAQRAVILVLAVMVKLFSITGDNYDG